MHKDKKVIVIIPNWNGEASLAACIDSVLAQSLTPHLIVVDNGSIDGSVALMEERYPEIEIIRHDKNKGYAGGVNPGFKRAMGMGAEYAAPFNNDAIADSRWLETLVSHLDSHPEVGIATCKVTSSDGEHLDSTGDYYTNWGLSHPRGRGEPDTGQYDGQTDIFGASGAASLYRVSMLREIGLFDEDFFAYYEDIDLSFRAQLAGWKIAYVPASVVYHEIGATSGRLKGFTTYQTTKNLPWLLWKNVPASLLLPILSRFTLAYVLFLGRAVLRGHAWYAFKGVAVTVLLLPKKLVERRHIQSSRKVTPQYINSIITHDLPPNAYNLRKLRSMWWNLTGRKTA